MVVRDASGKFVAAMALAGISSPPLAEMMAARAAVLFARDLEAAYVEFAGDAQMVTAALQQNSEDDTSPLGHVINDARHFLYSIPHSRLSFTKREADRVAHRLARLCTCMHLFLFCTCFLILFMNIVLL